MLIWQTGVVARSYMSGKQSCPHSSIVIASASCLWKQTYMRRLIAASPGRAKDGSSQRADLSAAACRLVRTPKPFPTFRWSSGLARRSAQETTTSAGISSQSGRSTSGNSSLSSVTPARPALAGAGAPPGGHDSRHRGVSAPTGGDDAQQHDLALRALHAINDSTKWTITAAAAATLIRFPSAEVLWCITGSVAAAVVCKVSYHVQGCICEQFCGRLSAVWCRC